MKILLKNSLKPQFCAVCLAEQSVGFEYEDQQHDGTACQCQRMHDARSFHGDPAQRAVPLNQASGMPTVPPTFDEFVRGIPEATAARIP